MSTLADGSIRNGYTIKILNMEREARSFTLALDDLDAAAMTVVGQEEAPAGIAVLSAPSDSVATYRVLVTLPRQAVTEAQIDFAFVLIDEFRRDRAQGLRVPRTGGVIAACVSSPFVPAKAGTEGGRYRCFLALDPAFAGTNGNWQTALSIRSLTSAPPPGPRTQAPPARRR